jgi:hypothetical protein
VESPRSNPRWHIFISQIPSGIPDGI